jgi:hypothetical protein
MLRTTRWMLALFAVGVCTLGYGDYNQQLKDPANIWTQVWQGTAAAPEQYRVGVVMAAFWVTRHAPVRLSQVFGVFDEAAGLTAVLLLYALTVRKRVFRESSLALQWFGSAAFAALTMYLLVWTRWYGKVSTLPSACAVACMVWLWTPRGDIQRPAGKGGPSAWKSVGVAAGLFFLVLGLSFVRADVALLFCVGVFLASATRLSPRLSLPRGAAMGLSLASGLTAGGVQLWLMKVVYPQANYGPVHVWMIAHDWWRLQKWAFAVLFLVPFLWTLRQAAQRRYGGEGAGAAVLLGALGYAGMWLTFGRLDEVRIFLPMALAVTPVTVEMALLRVAEAERAGMSHAG